MDIYLNNSSQLKNNKNYNNNDIKIAFNEDDELLNNSKDSIISYN